VHDAPIVDVTPSARLLTISWLGAFVLCLSASSLSAANGRPPEVFLPIGVSSAIYVTSGYLMARRRPDNRIGYLLVLIGVIQAGLVVMRYLAPAAEVLNVALSPFPAILIALVLLAYPSGELVGRAERFTMGAIAIGFAMLAVATVLTVEPALHGTSRCPPCAPNPFRITDTSVFPTVNALSSLAQVASAAAVSVLAIRRWVRAQGTARRVLAPVLFGGIVTAAAFLVTSLIFLTGGAFDLAAQLILVLQVLVPIGLAVTFIRIYAARGAVTRVVIQLGASPSTEALESALRRELHDPSLVVARWSEAAGAYLDREGQRVAVDNLGPGLAAMRLEREGDPLAAVIHDAALEVDPTLVETVADAVRFSVEAADIRNELHARGGDVAGLPRGEVAFLFGDLEGSTELLAGLGDAYIDVLAEVRRVVRDAADHHGGRVVDARADECFLAFADPAAAVKAALEIQHRLGEASWPSGASPRMRIGLHLGRPELTSDGYVGLDVHLAARVMATGKGGQVVASSLVATTVGPQTTGRVTFLPLGYASLKGIPEPEFLYRVIGAT
jgi:class 3 adenylate cyclase